MKFIRSTLGHTAAIGVMSLLLLSAGVFAYSARAAGAQTSPSPLNDKHESTSTHSSTHKSTESYTHSTVTTTVFSTTMTSSHTITQSTQTQSENDQNDNQGNQNDNQGNNAKGNGDGQQGENGGGPLHFTLYSPSSTNNGKDDRGQATIAINGTTLNVDLSVKKTSPSATFSVVLVAIPITTTSSTTTTSTKTIFSTTMFSTSTTITSTSSGTASCTGSIGTFVTDGEGEAEAYLSTTLSAGTYALGLVICSNNTPVLVSHPVTTKAVVPQGAEGDEGDSDDETTTSSTTTSTGTIFSTTMPPTTTLSSSGSGDSQSDSVNPVTKSGNDDSDIKTAISDKTIPAVISVLNSAVTLHQLDPRFSVAASRLSNNGIMISISAQNVTGPRVLLVNLTGSQWSTSSLQSLKVMFDGAHISQAASLSQILNSSSTDPARYIIMLTSSGLQLLVSIPHFSLHTIQLIPTVAPTVGFTSLDGAILVGVLVVFAALSVAVYSKRVRATPSLMQISS